MAHVAKYDYCQFVASHFKSALHYLLSDSWIAPFVDFSFTVRTILSCVSRWRWRDTAGRSFSWVSCAVSLLAIALLPEADAWPASINVLLQLCVQNMLVNSQLVPTPLEPPAVDSVVLRHHPSDEQASDFPVHPPASLHPAAPWKTVFSRHGHKCPKPSPLSLQVGS